MSRPSFEDLQKEYAADGVGSLLYGFILDIVRYTVTRYPPITYSPNGVWDEDAITSLCHDFTIEKLLGRGWLEYHLMTQETADGFGKILRRDFRHFMISRRERSEYLNLFSRVARILHDDPRFRAQYTCPGVAESIWGLAEWPDREVVERSDEIMEAMFSVELPPLIRYKAGSKKHSHLLSNNDLAILLDSVFRLVGKSIPLGLIMDGLRYRLGLLETSTFSLDEPLSNQDQFAGQTYADVIPGSAGPETEIASVQIGEEIFDKLTDRQRAVLALRLSLVNPTLECIGDRIGVSKSAVHKDLTAVTQCIADTDVSQDEAERILAYLSEVCLRYFEQASMQTSCGAFSSPHKTSEGNIQ